MIEDGRVISLSSTYLNCIYLKIYDFVRLHVGREVHIPRMYTLGLIVRSEVTSWNYQWDMKDELVDLPGKFRAMIRQSIATGVTHHLENEYNELFQKVLRVFARLWGDDTSNEDHHVSHNEETDEKEIELVDVIAPFALLVMGSIVGVIALFTEGYRSTKIPPRNHKSMFDGPTSSSGLKMDHGQSGFPRKSLPWYRVDPLKHDPMRSSRRTSVRVIMVKPRVHSVADLRISYL